jgi:hypothetical protein
MISLYLETSAAAQERKERGETHAFDSCLAQPTKRAKGRGEFFIFFGRNPLKRPDPEKQKKANERNFAWFYFRLLAQNSRAGCEAQVTGSEGEIELTKNHMREAGGKMRLGRSIGRRRPDAQNAWRHLESRACGIPLQRA